MQRSDYDFDVISGPSTPPLPIRPAEAPHPAEPTPATSLDPAARRTESPAQ